VVDSRIALDQQPSNHAILKVVTSELGRIPFKPTLKETLRLAHDPASVALRQQIAVWKSALETGNLPSVQSIRPEIESALNRLARLGVFKNACRIVTLLGVPAAAVGFWVDGISGAIPGFSASAAAAVFQEHVEGVEHTFRWAMFGNH
jgi:hypothetical protein